MRIDLDTRLTLAFVCGWGVVIGAAIASIFGYHVDTVVVSTAGSAIVATLGVGLITGSRKTKAEAGDGSPQDEETP